MKHEYSNYILWTDRRNHIDSNDPHGTSSLRGAPQKQKKIILILEFQRISQRFRPVCPPESAAPTKIRLRRFRQKY